MSRLQPNFQIAAETLIAQQVYYSPFAAPRAGCDGEAHRIDRDRSFLNFLLERPVFASPDDDGKNKRNILLFPSRRG